MKCNVSRAWRARILVTLVTLALHPQLPLVILVMEAARVSMLPGCEKALVLIRGVGTGGFTDLPWAGYTFGLRFDIKINMEGYLWSCSQKL